MRIRILTLADVIEDLETLYLKTTNFYGQAKKTIEKILSGSAVEFKAKKVKDNIREIFSIPFQLFIGQNPEPENQLKIEDLLSRAIAKVEHTRDEQAKSLYANFIRLFKVIHQTQDLLKQSYFLGFDVEKHFLAKKIRIVDSDLAPIQEFKLQIQNYMEDLKTFLSEEDQVQNLNLKDFVTGKILKNAKLGQLEGIGALANWWSHPQFLTPSHEEIATGLLGEGHSLTGKSRHSLTRRFR